jgi:hypothetical protein
MIWLPKCCEPRPIIDLVLNRPIDLYVKSLKVYTTSSGEQKSTYSAGVFVVRKMGYVKDRSTASQDTSITSGKMDPSTSKELIFKNFAIEDLKINEIKWEGVSMKMLGVSKLATVVIQGKRYTSPIGFPFISIIAGVDKL